MENELKKTHQYHLDSLRGIAALVVVLTHYIGAFFPYSVVGKQGEYQQHYLFEDLFFYPPLGLMTAGHMAVCLFFILSGYVLSYNYLGEARNVKKLTGAILKRPIRLAGVVLCTLIISAFLWRGGLYFNEQLADVSSSKPWFFSLWKGHLSIKEFLINISSSLFEKAAKYNVSLWTIQVELYGSILVFLTLFFCSNFKYRWLIFAALILILVKSFYQGFFLGILIADLVKHKPICLSVRLKKNMAFFFGGAFLYLGGYPHYANIEYINSTVYHFLPADTGYDGGYPMLAALFLFCFICLHDKVKILLNMRLLKYLGEISYGVYGVHILVIGSLSAWLFLNLYKYIGYIPSFFVVLSSGLFVIICLAHLITVYVDKPAIKLANFVARIFVEYFYLLLLKCKTFI
ncbi:hypothetical protein BJAS_P1867 [Bathymodiolus japonicus methanotrophic gill symbiont]|uniref:acyltransferase family protein n=1 Tax=Bathymodiolus japonicus methanotrophic gill symbiont TaxID=113269 RepID=UPI001B4E5406|nr:acyltransferase [Bathymodiolus japonicus methanotrophic gill symbiont]GFO71975.1 hypothetical protein BJAS_P1867 [Bathymodiolus japonicus methanotrophic gill symbiont]